MQIDTALAGRQRRVSVVPRVHPKVGDSIRGGGVMSILLGVMGTKLPQ